MEIGTFWMLSLRRCAVTVISSRAPVSAAAATSSAGAAAIAPEDTAPKIAATAYETFELMRNPQMPTTVPTGTPFVLHPRTDAAGFHFKQAREIFASGQSGQIERTRHPDVTSASTRR